MKEIKLTKGMVTLVDDADYEWLNQFKWRATKKDKRDVWYVGRVFRDHQGKLATVRMHRFILGINDPKVLVDHKDRNTFNNCRSNLRPCTNAQNACNRQSHKGSFSKYLGVSWHKRIKKWAAQISKDGKKIYLGYFDTEEAAALAYNSAASKFHGEFANLNKVDINAA